MSSQAERIKAFKLAQHARLQKQDEDEQWISSEELCTEGSSDEETHTTSVKTSHRKPKRNPKTEKRGISPLAQGPKATEIESTSTYQRDSKYLSPDLYSCDKLTEQNTTVIDHSEAFKEKAKATESPVRAVDADIEKLDLGASCSEAHSSKYDEAKADSLESDVDLEIEKMIQWRPKRGSIKLPEFPEGRESTLEHDIFEVNAFHTEMVAKLSFLKRQPRRRRFTLFPEIDKAIINSSEICEEKKEESSVVTDILQEITQLDKMILEKNNLYETAKEERQLIQEEMCNIIKGSEISSTHSKKSEMFLQLCHFENTSNEEDNIDNNANETSGDPPSKKQKKGGEKSDKNFVTRNIELAKQYSMAQFSLTDEEKVKLESLLSDIDSGEYTPELNQREKSATTKLICSKNLTKKKQNAEESENGNLNYFQLKEDDLSTLTDLEVKLTEILESYDESDRDVKLQQTYGTHYGEGDILENADREGRYWKHHQTLKRLENIEKDLAAIALQEAEQQKKMENQNEICLQENDSLEEYECEY